MTAPVESTSEYRAAFLAGRAAFHARVPVAENPYQPDNPGAPQRFKQRTLVRLWLAGWEIDRPEPPTAEQVARLEAGADSPA